MNQYKYKTTIWIISISMLLSIFVVFEKLAYAISATINVDDTGNFADVQSTIQTDIISAGIATASTVVNLTVKGKNLDLGGLQEIRNQFTNMEKLTMIDQTSIPDRT